MSPSPHRHQQPCFCLIGGMKLFCASSRHRDPNVHQPFLFVWMPVPPPHRFESCLVIDLTDHLGILLRATNGKYKIQQMEYHHQQQDLVLQYGVQVDLYFMVELIMVYSQIEFGSLMLD